MALEYNGQRVGAMQYNGVTIGEAMYNGQIVYKSGPPVVQITGTTFDYASRDQFRAALANYGYDYATITELPVALDISQATSLAYLFQGCVALTTIPPMGTSHITNMYSLFNGCASLTYVPDLQTSNVTTVSFMFFNCSSLTDGTVRLIGKRSVVSTSNTISGSGLTRVPFFNAAGQPI